MITTQNALETIKNNGYFEMITWELAMDRYKVTRFFLELLSVRTNKNICDASKMMVKDMWNPR